MKRNKTPHTTLGFTPVLYENKIIQVGRMRNRGLVFIIPQGMNGDTFRAFKKDRKQDIDQVKHALRRPKKKRKGDLNHPTAKKQLQNINQI